MAINTAERRFSIMEFSDSSSSVIVPDSTIDAANRATFLGLYSGIPLNDAVADVLGLVTETDTALPMTATVGNVEVPVGLTSETDSALTLTAYRVRSIGLATQEVDSIPGALSHYKILRLGLASETDTVVPNTVATWSEWLATLPSGSTTQKLQDFFAGRGYSGKGITDAQYEYLKASFSTTSNSERYKEWKDSGFD